MKKLENNIKWGHHIVDTRGTECPNAKIIHQVNADLGELLLKENLRKQEMILGGRNTKEQ